MTGQSSCTECPAGKYCDKTAIASLAELNTKECGEGHFCSGGTKLEKPIRTTHGGSICSSGKYCPTGQSTQLDCPGGTYDKRKGVPACMNCPKGYYCPIGSVEPTRCPATMFCIANVAAGTFCPDGTYNTQDGLEESGQCRPCPVGKFCISGQVQGSCNSGFWCNSGAKSATDATKPCPTNHYCEAGTSAPVRCEGGKVNPTTTGTSPAACVDCSVGHYCPETQNGAEIDCPAGFYCPARSTQPTSCPVLTYRATTLAQVSTDCIACGAGYLCNIEGVGDRENFRCPVGHFCVAGVKNPTKCPAGTYRKTTGAGATTDCDACPVGFYCGEGTINPVVCPGGKFCALGSAVTSPCTGGKYCPPGTTTELTCPEAYYCPEGVQEYVKCLNGTYCEPGSEKPTLCDSGTFGNGNPNNNNFANACVPCDAGLYSTTDRPGFCFPCTAGYVCLGQTTSETPTDKSTQNGYECPVGHYCPEGSSLERECPVGTYADAKRTTSLSGCKQCASGTFNDVTGKKGCKQCSGTSTSEMGATSCECIGIGREYVDSTGECLCAKGYEPAEGGANFNSVQNCELSTEAQCATDEITDITGKKCLSEAEYCKLECKGLGDETGTFIQSVRRCECTTAGDYDAGCEAASCTNNNIIKYGTDGKATVYASDGVTVQTAAYDPSSVAGVYGDFTCTRDDGDCGSTSIAISGSQFVYDFQGSAVAQRLMRHLGVEITEKPKGRQLATTTTITNPVVCIIAGNMAEFGVDSSTKSYPVYMKDSLLNTNDAFDYGGFLNLATTIESGTSSVSVYVHSFNTAGTYIFMNSLDNYQQTILVIVAADATCPATNTVSAATLAALYQLNLATTEEVNNVNMTFFIRLIATKIGLLVLLVGFITYMHSLDKKWTFFPWLRKKEEEEEEAKRKKAKAQKDKAIQLKSEELKIIRDELAQHVEKLRKRIAELEQERLKKMKDQERMQQDANNSKLLETLRVSTTF